MLLLHSTASTANTSQSQQFLGCGLCFWLITKILKFKFATEAEPLADGGGNVVLGASGAQSVAIALGLRAWLWHMNKNRRVILCHKSEEEHRRRLCDPDRCQFCRRWPGRTEWEKTKVLDALHDRKNL